MKLAIMQPYLFPYIGYFQLIHAVDNFVLYDDVTYIKQGWINRNRILLNGRDHFITLILSNASSFKLINEIAIGNNRNKLLKTIEQAYKKAPYFNDAFYLIEEILTFKETNIAKFVENSIRKLVIYFDIKSIISISSTIDKDSTKKGQSKVIDICKKLNAEVYINAIGGKEIYSKDFFFEYNLELKFIKSNPIFYTQFKNEFVPGLSIIDVMMFNSKEEIQKMLNQYELI